MQLDSTLKTAIASLLRHKSRSLLTILGIVIGIAAIILISAAGGNIQNVIVGELGGLGAETIVIRPGKEPKGFTDYAETLFADSLKDREFNAVKNKSNVPGLIDISPEILVPGKVTYGNESYKPVVLGFSAKFVMDAFDLELERGNMFDERDIRAKSKVVMIGKKVKEELFGLNIDPIGKYIEIKNNKFRIIGIFKEKGQVVFFNVDDLVLVPYSTAQAYLSGQKHYTQITARAENADIVDQIVKDIERTLRDLHNIKNEEDDDFYVETQQGLVEQVGTIIGSFTIFLSLVVGVALVVGGIGIMNIMLVSVTERTKEIGLRKAVGATNKDILYQFLLEAVLLTLSGGIIGILLGSLGALVVSLLLNLFLGFAFSFTFPYLAAFIGILSSALVGIGFGLYPALQASKKSPIEALRYE
ncbi:MAG: ABC transporter permease [Patescibacteria group bacterium]